MDYAKRQNAESLLTYPPFREDQKRVKVEDGCDDTRFADTWCCRMWSAEGGQPSLGRQLLALNVLTISVCLVRSVERRPPSIGLCCTNAESVPRAEL